MLLIDKSLNFGGTLGFEIRFSIISKVNFRLINFGARYFFKSENFQETS